MAGSVHQPLPRRSASSASPACDALALGVEQHGSTLYLRLSGEFDVAGVGRVEAALGRAAAITRRIVFDLRALSFLDLAGLRTILRADERSSSELFEVVVVRPRGLANRVFTLTRVGEHLTLVDSPPRP
jgi:anti-anti-sigma factor